MFSYPSGGGPRSWFSMVLETVPHSGHWQGSVTGLSLCVRNMLFQGLCAEMKMRPRRYRSTYSQNVVEQIVVNNVVVAAVVLVCKWSKVTKPLIKLVCNRLVFWHDKDFVSDILPVYSSCIICSTRLHQFPLTARFAVLSPQGVTLAAAIDTYCTMWT